MNGFEVVALMAALWMVWLSLGSPSMQRGGSF